MAALREAIEVLHAGGVVAFPTETSYGLAVDPMNPEAVARLYVVKARDRNKPLPLIAASVAQVRRTARLAGKAAHFAGRYWPGPLTIVLTLRHAIPALGTAQEAAIRVPGSATARALAQAFGGMITSTSANVSGEEPLYSGAAVRRVFARRARKPDLVLDAGTLPKRPASTIVRFRRGRMEVLRDGALVRALLR